MILSRWAVGVIVVVTLVLGTPLIHTPDLLHISRNLSHVFAAERIDINTAKPEELKALPGIGDAYSERIIKNRPYKRKDELVQKKIIPQATYDSIKDQIIARQN